MTDQEIIEIIKAHSEGLTIQYRKIGDKKYVDIEKEEELPWNFMDYEYRVKQCKVEAYRTSEEFIDDMKVHGPLLLFNEGSLSETHYKTYVLPISIRGGWVDVSPAVAYTATLSTSYSLKAISTEFIWQDGTPCYKITEIEDEED